MSNLEPQLSKYLGQLTLGEWEVDFRGVRKGEEDKEKWASPIPIVPIAVYENLDSKFEKIEVALFKNNRWKTIIVEREKLANANKVISLANYGVEVNSNNSKLLVTYFADVISASLLTLPHKDARSVLGWVGDIFVPYEDSIAYDGDENYRFLYNSIGASGNGLEWITQTKKWRENLELRLVMDASFASPLIERIGENCFCLHLWGGTGSGKTVALMVGASIWGNPANGKMVRTMNMTANSMMTTASFLNNLPFFGDELQTIKSRWGNYDNLIMTITEGIDRGRMSYDKVNETKSWKCAFIFTGEEPCVKSSSSGGAKNRVIEIECAGKLIENGNATANFVKANYGFAGERFTDYVKSLPLTEMYSEIFTDIINSVDTTDKQAGSMAILLLADRLACELFYADEKPLTVNDVKQYLASEKEVDVTERAYQFIVSVISENVRNFTGDGYSLWGTFDGKSVFVNKSVLERLLNDNGFDFSAVKAKWLKRGYMIAGHGGRARWRKTIGGSVVDCVKIRLPDEEKEEPDDLGLPFERLI